MSDPVDMSVLDELEEAVGPDFLIELIETFMAEAPGMMAELQTAHEGADTEGIRRAAHSLKSNATTFGAHATAQAAREIELEGLGASPEAAIAALQDALSQAVLALQGRIDG